MNIRISQDLQLGDNFQTKPNNLTTVRARGRQPRGTEVTRSVSTRHPQPEREQEKEE